MSFSVFKQGTRLSKSSTTSRHTFSTAFLFLFSMKISFSNEKITANPHHNFGPHKQEVSHSGLDKDWDQWLFHPLLFNFMSILFHIKTIKLQKIQSLVKRPIICLTYFKEKLLQIHVALLGKDLYNWCISISFFLLR